MEVLSHVSEKPWSDYTKSDYTLEQWHSACLIHIHQGAPTSKSECKLPVKTPGGALNRNGVHAAAAALAGARGGVQASSEQKASAKRAIARLYSLLDETPPPSIKQFEDLDDVLAHYGIMGMKWGVRRSEAQLARARGRRKKKGKSASVSSDAEAAKESLKKAKKGGGAKALSNTELKQLNERLNLEQNYNRLTGQKSKLQKGQKIVKEIVGVGKTINEVNSFMRTPLGRQIREQL